MFRSLRAPEARSILTLALPIALTQIGMVLYGTVDMLFVGRLGSVAIASVGLGAMTYAAGLVAGMGVVMGIDSHSAKAFGAGQVDRCGQLLIHTLVLSQAVSLPLFAVYSLAPRFYAAVGVDPVVASASADYLRVLRFTVFPALAFVACRQYLQSMSVTRPQVIAIVIGNLANALLDYSLVFGRLGAPALGVRGSAFATLTANFVMLLVMALAARARLGPAFRFAGWRRRLFLDVFGTGLPGGLQMLVEVAVFALVTALAGRLGADTLAAHQLTLNLASATFMVPMGIGHAAAARVGQALGRGDRAAADRSGRAAAAIAVSFMAVMGALFAAFPGALLGAFGAGATVVAIGTPLLYCSAAFQVFDGAQAVLTGALRGRGETRRPLLVHALGLWGVALPVGIWLCFRRGWGATGLWTGFVAGLAVVSVLLWREWLRAAALDEGLVS
jgi:MATE family multidrug resistance protein